MNSFHRPGITLLLTIATLWFGCSDEDVTSTGIPSVTNLSGRVYSQFDSLAVEGAKVALIEGVPYRVIAGPTTTDASGHFEFSNPPAGDWYLFVFTGSMLMLDPADARVSIRSGERISRDIAMIPSELWDGGPPLVVGVVTDADTGEPISGAYVSGFGGSVFHNFEGIMIDAEDITDETGNYSVSAIRLFLGGASGVINPLGVSKEGYAPFYIMDVPMSDPPDSLNVLDVALERAKAEATIQGRVVLGNIPLRDVPVAIDYMGIPLDSLMANSAEKRGSDPQRVPLLGMATRTNRYGRFEIEGVPPGTYFIDAAYFSDDGYVSVYDESGILQIRDDEIVDVGDIAVIPAILPVSPVNQEVVTDPSPLFVWQPIPGADRYRLRAGLGHFLDFERDIVGATSYQLEEELPAGTRVRWTVSAYRTATPYDEEIASFEAASTFTIGE